MNKKNFKKGFTLIELLIVIALLGALAVAMIAAIDPLEQFKRGQDTGIRNTAEEIYNSANRYYSVKLAYPWGTSSAIAAQASAITSYIDLMAAAGELKTDFIVLSGDRLNKIFVTYSSDSVAVCYQPTSKGLQQDSNTRFNSAAVVQSGTTCISQGGSSLCYWCLK